MICRDCGVVLGERCIDDGAEWRTFSTDDHAERADPNRCGESKTIVVICDEFSSVCCYSYTVYGYGTQHTKTLSSHPLLEADSRGVFYQQNIGTTRSNNLTE